jgi:hypothetical protein
MAAFVTYSTNIERNLFLSDKEIINIEDDSIDFGWLSEALREIILSSQTPITIGIIGDWGTGKTSIMKITQRLLEENDNAKTIWFNAWKYDRAYDLRTAFIQKILIDIKNDKTLQSRAKEIANDLIKRADWIAIAQSAASIYAGIPGGSLTNSILQLITKSVKPKGSEESISLIGEFDKKFQELIDIYAKDKIAVIFIDDIDRCLPEKAISILEAIKLFFDAEKCVFVIGINKKVIEKGVILRYKQLAFDGTDYLEKIIQIPFTLPELRDEDSKAFIESIAPKAIRDHVDIIAKVGGNPRRIKRIINKFLLQITFAKYKPNLGVKNEIIAKLSVLELRWGKFYEDMIRYYDKAHRTSLLLAEFKNYQNLTESQKNNEWIKNHKMETYLNDNELMDFLNADPTLWDVNIEPYIYLRKTATPDFEDSEMEKPVGESDNEIIISNNIKNDKKTELRFDIVDAANKLNDSGEFYCKRFHREMLEEGWVIQKPILALGRETLIQINVIIRYDTNEVFFIMPMYGDGSEGLTGAKLESFYNVIHQFNSRLNGGYFSKYTYDETNAPVFMHHLPLNRMDYDWFRATLIYCIDIYSAFKPQFDALITRLQLKFERDAAKKDPVMEILQWLLNKLK